MYKHLTHQELYYIWQHRINKFGGGILLCESVSELALRFGKHISTIYRAVKYMEDTNWNPKNKLRYREKQSFNMITAKMKQYIANKLKAGWSPDVICGRINKDIRKRLSFKTLYRYIWQDKAGGGKLYKLLPHHGKKYKYGSSKRSTIANRVDISQRPKIVEKKVRLGDFEGDTIVGCRGGDKACLLTLVDRASKFTIIRKIPNKTAEAVEHAMNDCYDNTILPFLTVTYDNGTEFANHQNISQTLGCDIYFARPYRSSDRGLNEHTNGRIRWFFPKKTDFGKITNEEVIYVQNLLNDRPRKSLNYLTPNEVVNKRLTTAYKKFSQLT
jgi:transposase, IS30 family